MWRSLEEEQASFIVIICSHITEVLFWYLGTHQTQVVVFFVCLFFKKYVFTETYSNYSYITDMDNV